MDEIALRHLIDAHARFPAALLATFQDADLELLRSRESEKRWSPLEILGHLRDEEVRDFRPRARIAIEGGDVPLDVDPERWVVEGRYNELDPGEVYVDWAAERSDSCRWLSTLRPDDLAKSLEHPRFGKMRAGDFIAAWRVHDLLHLKQFARAMAVLTARRLEGWHTEYAGRLPGA